MADASSAPAASYTFFGAELAQGPAPDGACGDRQHRRHARRSCGAAIAAFLLLVGAPARGAFPGFSRPRLRGQLSRMKHSENKGVFHEGR
jgi:hypothetical protein